jgi:alkylation response protein AidB-like acyl-CoA dehydrogenase
VADAAVLPATALAGRWRDERAARLARTGLDPSDFAAVAGTGFLLLAVPEEQGGGWHSPAASTRTVADALRALAGGDPSVALVSAMHPAVLAFWLANPAPESATWEEQRRAVFATAAAGAEWGTVTSEPGSGGDVSRTRAHATPASVEVAPVDIPGRRYCIRGDKHFGSGTGICSFMLTTAVPDGEDEPAAFFLDTRPLLTGGEVDGFAVVREWDGTGMRATQSHAVRLDGCPAIRLEWPRELGALVAGAAPVNQSVFTAVVLGVVDEAIGEATARLAGKADSLRAYERVEWARAVTDHWLMAQAYDGMLRAIESGDAAEALRAGLRGKTAAAELAEQVLTRITRVVGGGTFSRSSPFSSWFEDVRALGFLRPPWGLAFDSLYLTSFG